MKIAIIGNGNVGSALERGLRRGGHDVRSTGRENVRETAQFGEVIILAVPFGGVDDAVTTMGDAVNGKVVVDVTNALDENMGLAIGCTTSGAEELQKKAKQARVVKAFNTQFAEHMDSGQVNGQTLTVLVASDDDGARDTVLALAKDIGFDAVSAGPLQNARWLETLGYLNIQLGYVVGHGTKTGFRYVR
ncbi:MAG TPA: NAD(P)-binding domain-containing protein [Thermoanaerobaculia bacterium]|nr:NAD(P)-binding domain-containing protein [Thermoanaerobaculia bacterium]